MKVLNRKIHLTVLALAVIALVCMGAGQAFAQLTDQEKTEIQAAAASGDTAAVEAAIKKLMKRAMADGEYPETIARQASSAAVLAAIEAGQDFAAIARAASIGATSGAIEAAVDMNQDVVAAAKAACFGTRTGALQAAQRTGQNVTGLEQTCLQGSQPLVEWARQEFGLDLELEPQPEPEEPMTEDMQDPSPKD